MTHPRSQVRDAVRARLASPLQCTEAGDRVHVNRTTPLFAKALPAILVYARDEILTVTRLGLPVELRRSPACTTPTSSRT